MATLAVRIRTLRMQTTALPVAMRSLRFKHGRATVQTATSLFLSPSSAYRYVVGLVPDGFLISGKAHVIGAARLRYSVGVSRRCFSACRKLKPKMPDFCIDCFSEYANAEASTLA